MDAGYYSSEINIIRDACSLNDICGWYRQGQILWESGNTVETVALLTKKSDLGKKKRDFQVEMEVPISPDMHKEYKEQKPTYENIKKYIMEKHGVKVHTAYIAEIKRDCELDMRPNYNVSKKEEPVIKSCTPEKREYIMEALRYYRLVVQFTGKRKNNIRFKKAEAVGFFL